MSEALTGIFPIAPTAFFDDGRIDEEGCRRALDCMIDQGVDGICILANYSEQFLLSDEERAQMMKLSLEHVAVSPMGRCCMSIQQPGFCQQQGP